MFNESIIWKKTVGQYRVCIRVYGDRAVAYAYRLEGTFAERFTPAASLDSDGHTCGSHIGATVCPIALEVLRANFA